MIKFRNPGSNIETQIFIFKALYDGLKGNASFTTADMGNVIANSNLMSAYGHSGERALEISSKKKASLNSTQMNMKMYAEVFRMLGWIAPADRKKSYPVSFTFIGECAANGSYESAVSLAEQALLGYVTPSEASGRVKYTERARVFPHMLRTLRDLVGVMYKHELCLGPMSFDDDEETYSEMIQKIKSLRGDHSRLQNAFSDLCENLGMKKSSVDNSTRLPLGLMSGLGWIRSGVRNKTLYRRSLQCFEITSKGESRLEDIRTMLDIRLEQYYNLNDTMKPSAIRSGTYSLLARAGFDISSVEESYEADNQILDLISGGQELLFSPYQTLWADTVNDALGYVPSHTNSVAVTRKPHADNEEDLIEYDTSGIVDSSSFTYGVPVESNSERLSLSELRNEITKAIATSVSTEDALHTIFIAHRKDTQAEFYPFVADLFTLIGMPCQESRAGDNGARWDALIADSKESIPMEIKSPTEELHLSLKAVRQALENKVVLLSRNTHPTTMETTTLAVGYDLTWLSLV